MGRFIALRELKDAAGLIQPGSFIPGAEEWPHHIIQSNVNVGDIYDLHREHKLDGQSLAASRREQAQLAHVMAKTGCELVDDPDNDGRQLVVPAGKRPVKKAKAKPEPRKAEKAD